MTRTLAAMLLLAVSSAAAQTPPPKRPLRIEDYYRLQTVGSPSISPDGRWVTYTVATRIEDDNSTRTETWLVSTGGGDPSRVLHYGRDIAGVRWSSDNRIVYSADREDWAIHPERHAAAPPERRRRLPQGAIETVDGTLITLRDRPQSKPAAAPQSEFERRHQERFKGAIFDWKDFQRDGQPFPAPNLRARPAADIVVTRRDGSEEVIGAGDVRPANLAVSTDGTRVVFTADPDWRDELRYESPDLWLMSANGNITRLTNDDHVYSSPAFSPDSRWISFVRDPGTDLIIREKRNHGGPSDLYVMPADGGAPVNLTAAWDLEPDNPRWAPDGRHLYFTAATRGEVHLFRASVPAGEVTRITKGPRRLSGITFDRDFTSIAYTAGVHDAPADVYVARIDGSDERRLTNVHRAILAAVGFTRTERLQWPSKDGTPIEGWLTFPFGFDPARHYPLIVFSHGGPHAATGYAFDFKKHFFAANGYFVLDTNFRGSTGYGEAFKWATWGAWGDKDGEDVVAGVDHVLSRYPSIDRARVGHTGHSYGGFMTNWLIAQYPDRFAAAISGAGISNWISDYGTADIYRTKETEFFGTPWDADARARMIRQSPLTYAHRVKTPTLFVHGEVDQRVPYEEGEQMYFALRRRGVPAKMIQYAGQPHGIGGHWNNVHRMINELAWWKTYLK